ncbi:pancreatic lipase-related protein 2-like [Centruroides vittatus]|uniref:pancreatic lipase-related protein 2-like n=1 Tax=Centruroides vittatus TaxID=120091 RepID=UPI0035102FE2
MERWRHACFIVFVFCTISIASSEHSDGSIYKYALQSEEISNNLHYGIKITTVTVCYDYVGCFESNGTFSHIWSVPANPEEIQTEFLLYTRENRKTPDYVDYRDIHTLYESRLKPGKPIKVICHGFGGSSSLSWVQSMKNAFLKKADVQVIVIDWSKGAAGPNYLSAVPNSELVGRQIAVLLNQIRLYFKVNWNQMHAIGFSMGAQVVGFLGKSVQQMYSGTIARITALDPAGPLYEGYGPKVHVDKSDAEFVDAIHTNANDLLYGGVGMKTPVGHVDFYPNGGKVQPGCRHNNIVGFFKDIFTGEKEQECHHKRAVYLFIESILNDDCVFISFPCESYDHYVEEKCFLCPNGNCGRLGYNVEGSGVYYTPTNEDHPFCTFPILIAVQFSSKQEATLGQIEITLITKSRYNETYQLTDKRGILIPGNAVTKRVNASPKMEDILKVIVTYKTFNGYFRKGHENWIIDNIIITKPSKPLFTACHLHLYLDNVTTGTVSPNKC